MSIEDDIALLEAAPSLAVLGREALRILAIGAESQSVEEGAVLFHAGERADAAYLVETGSFRLLPSDSGEGTVASRGALLGELALLTETLRPATARAQELSSVMRIPRALFRKMLDGYPDVAHRLQRTLLARTRDVEEELRNLRAAFAIEQGHPLFAAMQSAQRAKAAAAAGPATAAAAEEADAPTPESKAE